MADYHIGEYATIDRFVAAKLKAFEQKEVDFSALFSLMFQQETNVMYERSEGYRIRKTTYGEAKSRILAKAAALRRLLSDLPQNGVVGLYMQNSLAWIETFWAILAAGFRPLLMNTRLPESVLLSALRDCGCETVISDGKAFPVRTIACDALPESGDAAPPDSFGSELLIMSSGTSHHVKICAYTAQEFYYQIHDSYAIIKRCAAIKKHYEGNLKLLAFLPFYHVFGLIAVYIWFAFFSRTFVHLNDLSPQTIVNTVRRHKVTHIFAVPLFWETVYEQAMKTIEQRGESVSRRFHRAMALRQKLPGAVGRAFARTAFKEVRENLFGESIRFMITGGSVIARQVLDFFNGIGYRLVNGYGMTEVGITSVELSPRRAYCNGGFVGRPMTYARYAINEQGELLVQGKVMAAYVLCDGQRRERPEWFNTHDLACCRRGHYQILGRRDDLIVAAGGENINPNLLEPRLLAKNAGGVCLIGHKQGEQTEPVLLVSVNPHLPQHQRQEVAEETRRLVGQAGLSGQVRQVVYTARPLIGVEEFKPDRLRLAEEYASGTLPLFDIAAPDLPAPGDERARRVAEFFAGVLGKSAEDCSPDADFFLDEGGTSLDYFALITRLEEEFGIDFPTAEGKSLHTIRALSDYIIQHEADETI